MGIGLALKFTSLDVNKAGCVEFHCAGCAMLNSTLKLSHSISHDSGVDNSELPLNNNLINRRRMSTSLLITDVSDDSK
jgi:hypothetical protein